MGTAGNRRRALLALGAWLALAPLARAEGPELDPQEALDVRPPTSAMLPDFPASRQSQAAAPEREVDAVPPSATLDATAIGEGWFSHGFGYDVLESHDLSGYEVPVTVGVARKWVGDKVKLLIYVIDPPQMDEVGWLWTRELGHRDDILMYFSPQLISFVGEAAGLRARKVGRLPTGLPPLSSGGIDSMLLETFRPHLPGELLYERLPDEEVFGEPCRVVEGKSSGVDLGFDRVRLYVSGKTGVALRTVYFQGEREMRRLETKPDEVKDYAGRLLPSRRTITTADGTTAVMAIRDHLLDRPLEDRLFTRLTLKVQRFPRFDWQAKGPDGIDWRR